jgi:hypothetical protein
MKLLLLRPAHLYQGPDLDGSLSNRDLASKDRGFRQGTGSDDTQAALAHILDSAGDGSSTAFLHIQLRELGDHYPEVLGEPRLVSSIAFGFGFHGNPSSRETLKTYIAQMD